MRSSCHLEMRVCTRENILLCKDTYALEPFNAKPSTPLPLKLLTI